MGWLGTWAKRKAIKYGTTKPGSSLTDFPLLISISADSDLGTALGSTPKLALTLADGTTAVNHGRISWSYSGGNVTANIRAKFSPTSSASTGDVLGYIYYDSTQTDTQNKSGVLTSDVVVYSPFEDTPTGSSGDVENWAGNNGTSFGSMGSGSAAKIGNGLVFDGSNDGINYGNPSAFNNITDGGVTVRAIVKATGSGNSNFPRIVHKADNSSANGWYFNLNFGIGTSLEFERDAAGGEKDRASNNGGFTVNTLSHACVTWDGNIANDPIFYGNATSLGGLAGSVGSGSLKDDTAQSLYVGNRGNGARAFQGTIDELWIQKSVQSADWIAYDYQNQFNNSNTVTLGSEEAYSSGINAAAGIGLLDLTSVAPTVAKRASAGIGLVKYTAVAPTMNKAVAAGIGLAKLTPIVATSTKAAAAGIGLAKLTPVPATTNKAAAAGIGLEKFTSVAPASSKAASSGVGRVTLASVAPTANVGSVASVGLIDITPVAPASSKAAASGIGSVGLRPPLAGTSKAAAAGLGRWSLLVVAPIVTHAAAAGIGSIDLVGTSPATTKRAASGLAHVEFAAAAIDATGSTDPASASLVASACFVWRVGLGCTIEKVT